MLYVFALVGILATLGLALLGLVQVINGLEAKFAKERRLDVYQ